MAVCDAQSSVINRRPWRPGYPSDSYTVTHHKWYSLSQSVSRFRRRGTLHGVFRYRNKNTRWGARTLDHRIKSPALYQTELTGLTVQKNCRVSSMYLQLLNLGINPTITKHTAIYSSLLNFLSRQVLQSINQHNNVGGSTERRLCCSTSDCTS